MPSLVLTFLVVSCVSLVFQVVALTRLARQHAGGQAEQLVGRGYVRTIACRVVAAVTYVVVAAVQLVGDGTLSAEAVIVFAAVQGLWISNSAMDIRTKRSLSQPSAKGRHAS